MFDKGVFPNNEVYCPVLYDGVDRYEDRTSSHVMVVKLEAAQNPPSNDAC